MKLGARWEAEISGMLSSHWCCCGRNLRGQWMQRRHSVKLLLSHDNRTFNSFSSDGTNQDSKKHCTSLHRTHTQTNVKDLSKTRCRFRIPDERINDVKCSVRIVILINHRLYNRRLQDSCGSWCLLTFIFKFLTASSWGPGSAGLNKTWFPLSNCAQ